MFSDLVLGNRSYRRFEGNIPVSFDTVRGLIGAARLIPSAGNLQRIRYAVLCDQADCDAVFPLLTWAAYLKDWDGPLSDERPTAYVILMTENDPDVNLAIDIGIAAQTILLAATEAGLGGCMLRSFRRDSLDALLNKSGYHPVLVIALGVPKETVRIVPVRDGNIRYFREPDGTHCVPKRSLDDLLL